MRFLGHSKSCLLFGEVISFHRAHSGRDGCASVGVLVLRCGGITMVKTDELLNSGAGFHVNAVTSVFSLDVQCYKDDTLMLVMPFHHQIYQTSLLTVTVVCIEAPISLRSWNLKLQMTSHPCDHVSVLNL